MINFIHFLISVLSIIFGTLITKIISNSGKVKIIISNAELRFKILNNNRKLYTELNFILEIYNPTNSKKSLRDFCIEFDKRSHKHDMKLKYLLDNNSYTELELLIIDTGEIKKYECSFTELNLWYPPGIKQRIKLKFKQGGSRTYKIIPITNK